jgi:hypothetical protein
MLIGELTGLSEDILIANVRSTTQTDVITYENC